METVHKASPLGQEPIEDGHLSISLEIPKHDSLEQAEALFEEDAIKIWNVLFNHLPQGTRHRLLIKMLQGTLNLYIGK